MARQRPCPHGIRRSRKGHHGRIAHDLGRLTPWWSHHCGKCLLMAADRQLRLPRPSRPQPAPGSASPARARRSEKIPLAVEAFDPPAIKDSTLRRWGRAIRTRVTAQCAIKRHRGNHRPDSSPPNNRLSVDRYGQQSDDRTSRARATRPCCSFAKMAATRR